MTIEPGTYKYRKELARKFAELIRVLGSCGLDGSPINPAISSLKNPTYIPKVDEVEQTSSDWGYEIDNLIFETNLNSAQYPRNVKRVKITFSIKLVAERLVDDSQLQDPLKHLELNIVVEGYNRAVNHIASYHLDRHPDKGNTPEESHPKYHFQFGGRKLIQFENTNFGSSLILDSPRILHHPMDLVMGIDFVTSNFIPEVWKRLRDDPWFTTLLEESHNFLMKPFFHSLASRFNLGKSTINWDCNKICPYLT